MEPGPSHTQGRETLSCWAALLSIALGSVALCSHLSRQPLQSMVPARPWLVSTQASHCGWCEGAFLGKFLGRGCYRIGGMVRRSESSQCSALGSGWRWSWGSVTQRPQDLLAMALPRWPPLLPGSPTLCSCALPGSCPGDGVLVCPSLTGWSPCPWLTEGTPGTSLHAWWKRIRPETA